MSQYNFGLKINDGPTTGNYTGGITCNAPRLTLTGMRGIMGGTAIRE